MYYGVAFHNASAPENLRIAVETEFLGESSVVKDGIRIVVSTDTLAYGVNSNVDTVIGAQMERYSLNQFENLSFNTYQNCIGRSGRLGYRSYGTSYTFFSESFEAKYLDSQAPPLGLPMKAIRFYTRDAAEEGERISGTFGTLLLYAEADRLAFFVLSLFPEDSPMTVETVLEQISRIPRSDGCDPDRVRAEIVESIQMLKDYKLIQAYEDWSDQEETAFTETGYHLTAKGHLVQGYVIRWESFRRLHTILDETLTEGKLYPLDYYVQLAKIPEIFDSWHTVLMTYEAGEKRMGGMRSHRLVSRCRPLR